MKKRALLLTALLVAVVCPAYALYSVSPRGEWPADWPKELEPLRAQSRTLVGPSVEARHYAITFATREEFEAAWPHLLKVKSKGAPIFLVRGENFFLGEKHEAGVVVHAPPIGQHDNPATPEAPIKGVKEPRMRWMNTTTIELVVDGHIVDLNRIALPEETPIIDHRFVKPGSVDKR
jgi:hypothetical protein